MLIFNCDTQEKEAPEIKSIHFREYYCNVIVMELQLQITGNLQLLNAAICLIKRMEHITSVLHNLHCLLISFWMKIKVLVLTCETTYV